MIKKIFICLLKMIPYLAINAVMFYVVPIYATYIPLRMLILLTATPTMVFIVALIYGGRNSINFIYCILATGVFWPAIDMYYKEEGYIYLSIFGALNLTGNIIGRILYKRKKEIKLTFSEKRQKTKNDKLKRKEEKEERKLEKEVDRAIKKENRESKNQKLKPKHDKNKKEVNKSKPQNKSKPSTLKNEIKKENEQNKQNKKPKNKANRYKKNEYKKSVKKKKKR